MWFKNLQPSLFTLQSSQMKSYFERRNPERFSAVSFTSKENALPARRRASLNLISTGKMHMTPDPDETCVKIARETLWRKSATPGL